MLISSRENPLIKEAAALVSDKKARKQSGLFVAEGARLCSEACKSGAEVLRLFVTEEAEKKYPEYLKNLLSEAKEVYNITCSVAEKISDTKSPQGVFAVCRISEKEVDLSKDGVFVLLSNLQDPGNIGTILRTCEAMDAKGVFLCGCADCFSPKVLRGTMGCIFRLPIRVFSETAEALALLHEAGVSTYASALAENALLLPEVKFSKKSCVLIGNEGNGLEHEVIEACEHVVMIPMPGKAESLNAASAAAIMIYSAAMQK
ncbi:MAG: RNA methyltransferase [Oscillospiraceae bacterium]|nr:RNA methyltransferase [Oscillospiraceae bacterium]MBQ4547308.1 RNA methyltransferase [Oscillospiraceae bacterium]MBQ4642589.1 RNA methyltransferase [Oscillospiraceae bacterium]